MKVRLAAIVFATLGLYGCAPGNADVVDTGQQPSSSPSASSVSSWSPENPMPGSIEDTELGDPKPQDEGFKLGSTVDVGGYTVKATGWKCGVQVIPAPPKGTLLIYGPEKPQGEGNEFCFVSVTIKNTSKRPNMLSAQDQYGWAGDTLYRQIPWSTNADYHATGTFAGYEANPGAVGRGEFWFEVPKGTVLTELEVHGNDTLTNGTGRLIKLS